VSSDLLRLEIEGHHNPYGNLPSRARRVRLALGAVFYARAREDRSRGGLLQALTLLTLLSWAQIPAKGIERAGRVPTYLDGLGEDLARTAAYGGPELAAPIERAHRPLLSLIKLRPAAKVLDAIRQRRATHGRRRVEDSRPPVAATRTGQAGSRGP